MFRLATITDIDKITEIYSKLHTSEEKGEAFIGWNRKIYPTKETAEQAIKAGDMFVEEFEGSIVAAARINKCQLDIYKKCDWKYAAEDNEVMVLHTLVVNPDIKGKGFGSQFAEFYEKYASEHSCTCLRIDTNEKNTAARSFYKKHGYTEAAIIPCVFNNLPDVNLVLLEKKL